MGSWANRLSAIPVRFISAAIGTDDLEDQGKKLRITRRIIEEIEETTKETADDSVKLEEKKK